MTTKISAWAVAAALLLVDNNNPRHYESLAEDVVDTKLSGLGVRGSTPKLTLHRSMTQDKHTRHFFTPSECEGQYQLDTQHLDQLLADNFDVRSAISIIVSRHLASFDDIERVMKAFLTGAGSTKKELQGIRRLRHALTFVTRYGS